MTISLQCSCSAQLEIDEKFSGQTITCPDCRGMINVPTETEWNQQTSLWALASLVLALVGAFTIIGTVAAIFVGIVALIHIRQNVDRLAGKSYAITGIVLGALFTILSITAYSSGEIFGLSQQFRQVQWLGKLDYSDDKEISRSEEGFVLDNPGEDWGVYRPEKAIVIGRLDDLLIVNPQKDAYIVVLYESVFFGAKLSEVKADAMRTFGRAQISPMGIRRFGKGGQLQEVSAQPERIEGNIRVLEMVVTKRMNGNEYKFLVKLMKKTDDRTLYIFAAGSQEKDFDEMEPALREIMESIRLTQRAGGNFDPALPNDW